MSSGSSAWGDFWRDAPPSARGATLADLPPASRDALDAPWARLAEALPRKARVLDLATGGGIVLDLLRHRRRDLLLTGVDAAPDLPKRPGMTLTGGIATDRLPFPDGRFDAVTSRFGIEYGPLASGAGEAARVLRTGGRLCLVVHHAGSRVIAHNRARRDALIWAVRESGWVAKALTLATTRAAMAIPTPAAFRAAPNEAMARFPGQSAGWEFLTGLAQILDATAHASGGAAQAGVRDLVARGEGEVARLDALLAAACDDLRLVTLTEALTVNGVVIDPVATADETDSSPLAWVITGRRV